MDGVLELYPLELEELAEMGYALGQDWYNCTQFFTTTSYFDSTTALPPSQEFCEFQDGLFDCGAVSELYLLWWYEKPVLQHMER